MTTLESDLRAALLAHDAGRVRALSTILHQRAASGYARTIRKPSSINTMNTSRVTSDNIRQHLTPALTECLAIASLRKPERELIADELNRRTSNAGKGFTSTRRTA